ncbi:hypothetical protein NEAUS03_0188 [Nematocida ausubeli]|nr:hypothetical protein NEAUS03_0188 [Nematocida ausubeli]
MFSIMKSNLSKRKNQLLESKEVATEDLKVHRIRQEEKKRAVQRAKLYMLIGLAILCHAWDSVLTVDGLRNVQIKAAAVSEETEEGSQGGEKFTVEEITRNIGFMTRKRFLSPEIQLDHSIEVLKKDSENIEACNEDNSDKHIPSDSIIYKHTRKFSQDRLRNNPLYEGDLFKYKNEYFNMLLELFPSLGGYASIWTNKEGSFYVFINGTSVKEHKYKILASLLLLSEGVNVPLEVNKGEKRTDLVLKKADGKEEHFRINMTFMAKKNKYKKKPTGVHEKVLQEKAIDVINFFIESRENPVYKKEEPTLQSLFCRKLVDNKFLNSPSFLIQAYIHHYIEKAEKMVLFIQTVHDLLNEFIDKKEGVSREVRIEEAVNNLLSLYMEERGVKPEDKKPDNKAAVQEKIVSAECNMPKNYILIGKNSMDVTHFKKRSLYNDFRNQMFHKLCLKPLEDSASKKENMGSSMGQANYCETALFGLFCSAAYNSNPNIYTVHDVKSASKELRGFFRKYMIAPTDKAIIKRMHQDWADDIVFGENSQETQYMWIDGKTLMPGLINILYGFSKIAGICDLSKIDEIRRRVNDMNINGSVDDSNKIEKEKKEELESIISEYMTELIKKIALNYGVSVQTSINSKMSFKDGCSDVFGGLKISYTPINKQDKDVFQTYSYCYEFNICPDCSNDGKELTWTTNFNAFQLKKISKNLRLKKKKKEKKKEKKEEKKKEKKKELSIIEKVELYVGEEIQLSRKKAKECKKNSKLNKKEQLKHSYADWSESINTLLLDSQIYSGKDRRTILCGLFLFAKGQDFEEIHPLACLAENIMKNSCYNFNTTKGEVLIMHSLGIADKCYPNTPIDMDAYKERPNCFITALKHVLELATNAKYISHKKYANIITDLMIKFRETCLEDSYYSSLESFAKELDKNKIILLIKILTRNGHSIKHITKIVQAMQKTEKEHSVADYEKHSNQFLLWFILGVEKSISMDSSIALKDYCRLIDIREIEKINSETFSSKWGIDINIPELFKEIKYIICIEEGREECE